GGSPKAQGGGGLQRIATRGLRGGQQDLLALFERFGRGRRSGGSRGGLLGRAQRRRKNVHFAERNLGDFRSGKLLFQRIAKCGDVSHQHDVQIARGEIFARGGLHLFQ